MQHAIGVDIGGTKVAIAIVDEAGNILTESVIPTDLSIPAIKMVEKINNEIEQVIKRTGIPMEQLIGIGIGAPGPLDSKHGIITSPPNLSGWIDVPISHLVEQHFSIPVSLENDANAAAMAERLIGAAQENDNFAYITVSTGIGAGIVAEGKLLRGLKGNAGDIGHTVVEPSFGKCTCGQYGCLEWIASGTAIARQGSAIIGKDISTKDVFNLYFNGNKEIIRLIEKVFRVLGVASVSVINTFDTEKIVIGGGVSKVGDPLFQSIQAYVSEFALNETGRQTEIVPAKLEQSSGVIGAAALCFTR
ncbi:glucokinase [Virgibacillus subterraneus]|uniref:Glucokinase n=1 Tax=Virgibacillus subterraneus TaxID=621109 RepID=A0A1H9B252_9BACI|nr:ROK family protein [Virgibacillus subterraneus]SEP82915.1 glucokinase [Virgibacillus subterraneus]